MKKINITNPAIKYEYFILETYVAGLKLIGSEVKSIREMKSHLLGSYCYFDNGELYVKDLHIPERGSSYGHQALRTRKLLLKKRELIKLENSLDKHLTIVPYRLFENERGIFKLEICLVKGKKTWDKRQSIKERDIDRDIKKRFGK